MCIYKRRFCSQNLITLTPFSRETKKYLHGLNNYVYLRITSFLVKSWKLKIYS